MGAPFGELGAALHNVISRAPSGSRSEVELPGADLGLERVGGRDCLRGRLACTLRSIGRAIVSCERANCERTVSELCALCALLELEAAEQQAGGRAQKRAGRVCGPVSEWHFYSLHIFGQVLFPFLFYSSPLSAKAPPRSR